jgi:hypothetical protein
LKLWDRIRRVRDKVRWPLLFRVLFRGAWPSITIFVLGCVSLAILLSFAYGTSGNAIGRRLFFAVGLPMFLAVLSLLCMVRVARIWKHARATLGPYQMYAVLIPAAMATAVFAGCVNFALYWRDPLAFIVSEDQVARDRLINSRDLLADAASADDSFGVAYRALKRVSMASPDAVTGPGVKRGSRLVVNLVAAPDAVELIVSREAKYVVYHVSHGDREVELADARGLPSVQQAEDGGYRVVDAGPAIRRAAIRYRAEQKFFTVTSGKVRDVTPDAASATVPLSTFLYQAVMEMFQASAGEVTPASTVAKGFAVVYAIFRFFYFTVLVVMVVETAQRTTRPG